MTRNQIRQIAVWAVLGASNDQSIVDAFVRDVIPDWNRARQLATEQLQAKQRGGGGKHDADSDNSSDSDQL